MVEGRSCLKTSPIVESKITDLAKVDLIGEDSCKCGLKLQPTIMSYSKPHPSAFCLQNHLFVCESVQVGQALNGVIDTYRENARIIYDTFTSLGFKVYGGKNATIHLGTISRIEILGCIFAEILEKAHVITVPGRGFGPGGEEFIRISAFGD
ncbi:probable LL-diaminopimelate aminotransferase, chloroplastic [Camellia sinensis]|uniref:probable LL-diaminopimelate aminotransferase, chloroplastic n=1 Tax=Camellia sinensis TaxID=4442 RepID=UPI0010368C1B|nr:probable LL-diaminopimelate aminotransferase, chloroplastic [Camellia sinensis]